MASALRLSFESPYRSISRRISAMSVALGSCKPVRRRFSGVPWDTLSAPLPEGGFRARLEGPGLAPTSALPVELYEGLHFVQGRVDGP